jgi:phosphoribosylaminoimidazole carboxylase (NCAIR synthetase)
LNEKKELNDNEDYEEMVEYSLIITFDLESNQESFYNEMTERGIQCKPIS